MPSQALHTFYPSSWYFQTFSQHTSSTILKSFLWFISKLDFSGCSLNGNTTSRSLSTTHHGKSLETGDFFLDKFESNRKETLLIVKFDITSATLWGSASAQIQQYCMNSRLCRSPIDCKPNFLQKCGYIVVLIPPCNLCTRLKARYASIAISS